MTHLDKLNIAKNVAIASLFAIMVVWFSGLFDPLLPILCGIAVAIRLYKYDIRVKSFVFLLIIISSLLETHWWFLGESTVAFGASGVITSWILVLLPRLLQKKYIRRIFEILPTVLVIVMMPLPSFLVRPLESRRGLIDGGEWAKAGPIPTGAPALATKYQYGYEQYRSLLNAKIVTPGTSLREFDELIVITPTTPFDDAFFNDLCKWTASGGRLLIVADHTNLFGHQTVLKPLLEKFGIAIRPDAVFETETNGGVYSNLMVKFSGLTPCSISKGVIPRLKMTGWSESADYTASSFFGELQPSNDDYWGHHAVLGTKRCGLGEVTVFTDSTFFANFAINRWSSNVLMSSIFWPRVSSIAAIIGFFGLFAYLWRPAAWVLFSAMSLVLLSPALGFVSSAPPSAKAVTLQPPGTVVNESEERDNGTGSSLLASAYAFDLSIRWNSAARTTFKDHIRTNGICFLSRTGDTNYEDLSTIPRFDIGEIINGRFYLDQNSFWFGQGAGPVRTANAANCWRTLGAVIPTSPSLTLIDTAVTKLRNTKGNSLILKVSRIPDNWAVIDDRIVGKWIPESKKWLIRKEWQLGPWLKSDLILESVP